MRRKGFVVWELRLLSSHGGSILHSGTRLRWERKGWERVE